MRRGFKRLTCLAASLTMVISMTACGGSDNKVDSDLSVEADVQNYIDSIDMEYAYDLAETLALSLEFKMAGEILKTVVSHTIEELSILGAVIVLRALLTFLIHWEIGNEKKEARELQEQQGV